MGNSEMIGHDPLAWIKDGAVENSAEVSRSSEQAQEREIGRASCRERG